MIGSVIILAKKDTIYDLADISGKAYQKAITVYNIVSEFRNSGLLDRNVFTVDY